MTIARKGVILVAVLFCLLVSVYQNYDRVQLYMMFATDVDHFYTSGFYGQLPTLTFCGPKSQFVSDQYYKDLFGNPIERPINAEDSAIIEAQLKNMSISEQFIVLAQDLAQKIDCKFANSNHDSGSAAEEHNRECLRMVDISHFIYNEMFCFTLNYRNDSFVRYFPDQRVDPLMSVKLRLPMTKIMVGLKPSYDPIFEINPNSYEVVSLEATKTTNIFFEQQTIKYLPQPYDTNCMQYGAEEAAETSAKKSAKKAEMAFKSENECHNQCKVNYFQQYLGCVPTDSMPIFNGQSVTVCQNRIGKRTYQQMLSRMGHKCRLMCPTECYKEMYQLWQNKALFDSAANDTHVINVFPSDMSLNLVYTPVLTFVELLSPLVNVVLLSLAFVALYLMLAIRMDNTSDTMKEIK